MNKSENTTDMNIAELAVRNGGGIYWVARSMQLSTKAVRRHIKGQRLISKGHARMYARMVINGR